MQSLDISRKIWCTKE